MISAFARFGVHEKRRLLGCARFRAELSELYRAIDVVGRQPDLARAAKRLGIRWTVDPRCQAHGHIGKNAMGDPVIRLRTSPESAWGRFVFAHELAHAIVDRRLLVFAEGPRGGVIEELWCDFIAGLLLMPLANVQSDAATLARKFPSIDATEYHRLRKSYGVGRRTFYLQLSMLPGMFTFFALRQHSLGVESGTPDRFTREVCSYFSGDQPIVTRMRVAAKECAMLERSNSGSASLRTRRTVVLDCPTDEYDWQGGQCLMNVDVVRRDVVLCHSIAMSREQARIY